MTRLRRTNSFKVFQTNIERSRSFLRIFKMDRKRGHPTSDEKELLRGCLVFAIGALDAYLSDLILEIVPYYRSGDRHMESAFKQIAKDDPGLALRVALTESSDAAKVEFRNALEGWLESKSFQGFAKLANALSYLGCQWKEQDFDAETGMGTATELNRITKERNNIVHNGAKPYVKLNSAENMVAFIEKIATIVDLKVREALILGDWDTDMKFQL